MWKSLMYAVKCGNKWKKKAKMWGFRINPKNDQYSSGSLPFSSQTPPNWKFKSGKYGQTWL